MRYRYHSAQCDTLLLQLSAAYALRVLAHIYNAATLLTSLLMRAINTTATLLQVHTFYEAVACMLSDRGTTVSIDRAALLQQLMAMPNAAWREIFARAANQPDTILQPEVVKEVCTVYYSMYYSVKRCSACMHAPVCVNSLKWYKSVERL
jgi:hypothetical protein